MVRVTTTFFALSLLAVQAAIVQALEDGIYRILDARGQYGLGIGPVPPVYPPIDVPLRLFQGGSPFVNQWLVKRASGSEYTILDVHGGQYAYKIVPRENDVFVSAVKAPFAWTVTHAGQDAYTIKLPNDDLVVTGIVDEYPQVTLQPADGSGEQKWVFVKVDDMYPSYKKGSRNRLCVQEQW
ncbi:hypothetical protein BGZ73_004581 [Actinomortierella ambigua]|nr:hypothetical protein BGZ73_004581 [Actinomortierella ambigua]